MKRFIAFLLAVLCMLGVLAGCGKDEEKKPEENKGSNGTTDGGDVKEDPPPRVFDDPRQEALVVVAEAYYARRSYFQYDDSRLVTGNVMSPVIYRWELSKNSPEDGTSQHTCYTNCAAWAHDVYLEAFDFDIGAWYVGLFHDDLDMRVLYHTVTGNETEEEKAAIIADFKAKIQPGDVINCNHNPSGAHTLIYVGDGKILHSGIPSESGGDYQYATNEEKSEPQGTVAYTTIDDMFKVGNKYYLWGEKSFSITRPLQKFPQMQISEKTQNRIDNLQNIVVEMTSSHPGSITADLGEEITFTFSIRNGRNSTATVEVEDIVPEGSTYVSGADKVDGNKLSWTVEIPGGETKKVSYVVKVNNDTSLYGGGYIFSEDAKVGGVNVRCRPVYVGKHLTEEQQKAVSTAAANVIAGNLKGTDLAEKIYADAGITISLPSAKSILNSIYKPYKTTANHKELDVSSEFTDIIAPTMYGGYYVADSGRFYSRTRGMRGIQIMTGDIVLCVEEGFVRSYLYMGSNKSIDLETGITLDLAKTRAALMSTLGHDFFAIIRPGMK